jgi:hypothetical protein
MNKKRIRIQFVNGLEFKYAIPEILSPLLEEFTFIESDNPEVLVFGPYGNNIPKGKYIRVGYFCENFLPDMSICDWGFGIPNASEINHPQYTRIDYHGFEIKSLIRPDHFAEQAMNQKTKFCNFLYGNQVPYRENFFQELSKYKKIDAPGRSMNNHPSLEHDKKLGLWESKRQFLVPYKFTIAFENYTYPGYNTEKLLDPLLAGSIPIYIGNPDIENQFSPSSFVHGRRFIKNNRTPFLKNWEKSVQADFQDWRPSHFNKPWHQIKRKLKFMGRNLKLKWEFKDGFQPLIEEIIRLDQDDNAYYSLLNSPVYPEGKLPDRSLFFNQWRNIFNKI